MDLYDISLRTTYKSVHAEEGFNFESHAMPQLYRSFLSDYPTAPVRQINIFVSDNWENSLTQPMTVKGFKEAFVDFDFKKYFSLDKHERKRMQLEAIHEGMSNGQSPSHSRKTLNVIQRASSEVTKGKYNTIKRTLAIILLQQETIISDL